MRIFILLVMLLACTGRLWAADTGSEGLLPDPQEMARTQAAIDRALEHLVRVQKPDGAWPAWNGVNDGINAFCLLAFLGDGHEPGRGPYKPVVDRGVSFLLSTQDATGLFRSPNPSSGPMYDHALATLSMIEAYGFIPSIRMRQQVQRGVDLIVRTQSPLGGWRYQPIPGDADLSVTVMQIVALHSAQNARLRVPQGTVDHALQYVRSCAVPTGGFGYQGPVGPGAARTAAGILSMQLLGAFDDPAVVKGLAYMKNVRIDPAADPHFYYMAYYAMQAHFQAGGDQWASWQARQRRWLLDHQQSDGSWPPYAEPFGGPAQTYSTALGAMCLEVYLHYLPAYQR